MIYVRRHGLVFWGRSLDECGSLLEEFAKVLGKSGRLNPIS